MADVLCGSTRNPGLLPSPEDLGASELVTLLLRRESVLLLLIVCIILPLGLRRRMSSLWW
jgi:hypothetical protein